MLQASRHRDDKMGDSRIRLCNTVFIRHAGDESIAWCPRTGGCTVMRNAQPILEEVKCEWRDVEDIGRVVGEKFECAVDEVREGVEAVVGELVSQRFVEVDDREACPHAAGDDGILIRCLLAHKLTHIYRTHFYFCLRN